MVEAPSPLVAGIELGGTKCIAVLAEGARIVERARWPTGTPQETVARLVDWLRARQADGRRPAALGIGSFGPLGLDPRRGDYGRITTTPKPGWADFDLLGAFGQALDGPIALDTDVAGAALAEGRWGAAAGAHVHAYLTVGTGIGAGIVVNGRPVHGLVHPEVGHIRVRRTADGFAGNCPFHGDCLEGLASGPAIAARVGAPAGSLPDDHPIWERVADELGELIAILILSLSPERILIGGGVGSSKPALLPFIRSGVRRSLAGYLPDVDQALDEVVRAPALGDDAGPLGAAALALARLGC